LSGQHGAIFARIADEPWSRREDPWDTGTIGYRFSVNGDIGARPESDFVALDCEADERPAILPQQEPFAWKARSAEGADLGMAGPASVRLGMAGLTSGRAVRFRAVRP
jgi:hypothetical protein